MYIPMVEVAPKPHPLTLFNVICGGPYMCMYMHVYACTCCMCASSKVYNPNWIIYYWYRVCIVLYYVVRLVLEERFGENGHTSSFDAKDEGEK